MMKNIGDMRPGEKGKVTELSTPLDMRRRFLDIGLIPGTTVLCYGKSPLGEPKAYLIRDKVIAIRKEDAEGILLI